MHHYYHLCDIEHLNFRRNQNSIGLRNETIEFKDARLTENLGHFINKGFIEKEMKTKTQNMRVNSLQILG